MNEELMQEENMQSVDNEMSPEMGAITPEEAKASLGLATRLNEQMLISENPPMGEMSEEEEQAEEPAEETPEVDTESIKEELREEMKGLIQEEVDSIRKDIQDALKEDDTDEQED